MAVLEPLRELDEVAYLRFASVYQAWESLEDFEGAIALLRAERDALGEEPSGSRPARRPAVTTLHAPPEHHATVGAPTQDFTTSSRHGQGGRTT